MNLMNHIILKSLHAYPVILPIYTLFFSFVNNNMQWFLFTCWSLLTFLSAPMWKLLFRNIYSFSKHDTLPLLGSGKRPHDGYDFWGFQYLSKNLVDDVSYGMPSGHSLFAWMVSSYLILNITKLDQYPYKHLKIILLIILAISVSLSRYISNCHTIQQLIIGAIIGSLLGFLFHKIMLNDNLFHKNKIFTI
jgi:membrane-associated phospholipid phosphatase